MSVSAGPFVSEIVRAAGVPEEPTSAMDAETWNAVPTLVGALNVNKR